MSFSAVDGRKVEDANDAIVRLKSSITGVVRGLAIFVAPVVERLATLIKDNIVSARKSAISSFNEMKDGIISRLTAIIKIGLPIIILWARGAIAWFTLVGKVIFAVVEGIITVVVFLANSLNLLSEIAFGQGIIDNFKDILIAAQFAFKNVGRIVEVATLFIATKFFEFRDSVASVFRNILVVAMETVKRLKDIFLIAFRIKTLTLKDIVSGKLKDDMISLFDDITKPLSGLEPIASKSAKESRLAFETELKGFGNAFQDFRKKELEGAGDLTQKFLDFFKFKLPKLDLTESATSTIQAFGQDKTLQALEAGTAEALKVERKSQDNVEKNTKDMVSEQQKTNMLIQKLVDLPQVESELRGIE